MFDLEEARDKMLLGSENKSMVRTKDELLETAYHEAGHALLNVLLIDTDPFHKVTIIARGRTLGVSHSMPEKDTHSRNKKSLRANIMKALGGLIAERLALNTQTTGVSSDLENATKIAYNMVKYYGMSESLGAVSYSKQDCSGRVNYSQATSEKIDAEVQLIISSAYTEAELLLKDNFDKLEKLATTLVEKETLEAPEVYSLLGITPRVYHSLVDAKVLPVVEKEEEVKEGAEAKSEDE
jgi:cell division protease FtsH